MHACDEVIDELGLKTLYNLRSDKRTVVESQSDLRICPLKFLVFVVRPLYKETPDTPSKAATALISVKRKQNKERKQRNNY